MEETEKQPALQESMVSKETKVVKAKRTKEVKEKQVDVKQEASKAKESCNDVKCPFHGNLKLRGRIFVGTVISHKMAKTITVEWPRQIYLSKYERFEKRRSRVKAHLPSCIKIKVGDRVKIAECRPLSKTKNFVVIEVLSK